ncbi:hypothetical protein NOJ05_01785 [Neorhizobium galegae]|uniref:hypothetical protein n=1 Tax=Neorhizobium galegae TaxID=399 RepID=UPI00062218B5|nr:hypothetical protein [Neorhizobium galegae]CDZ29923.1 Hypothetical protein NGAL_HAMBI490_47910 [Neorhizobium galegae bv. officinalis]MCQ1768164.1 hypothetical protein [Neorhizobium galegae]MCQ1775924.1 hypothetical protein [Neorhizobium galegae]MCQ1797900.1 hypothetical protein [Neorhizobium galegae]MCQ1847136.1 hypothetical protein [Neorhizobium galegae]
MMTIYEGIKGELSNGPIPLGRVEYTVAEIREGDQSRFEGLVHADPSVLQAALRATALSLDRRRIVLGSFVSQDCASFNLTDRFL